MPTRLHEAARPARALFHCLLLSSPTDASHLPLNQLLRRTKHNPLLIGEAGVGKTAIVEGLAQLMVATDSPLTGCGRLLVAAAGDRQEDNTTAAKKQQQR